MTWRGYSMFNLTADQKEKRAIKIADQQGVTLDEAREIIDTFMDIQNRIMGPSGDGLGEEEGSSEVGPNVFSEDTDEDTLSPEEATEESESDEVDDLESDAIDKDFDLQMNHDTMDADSLETAQTDLATTVAKLREKKAAVRKLAQTPGMGAPVDPNDPQKQRMDELMLRAEEEFAQDPDVTPEVHDYARTMMADMKQTGQMTDDPEQDYELYKSLLGKDPQNRMDRALAAWGDPRFGVPEKEGKIYRSNINPRIFKTTTGKMYRLALDDFSTQMQSEETDPAPFDRGASPEQQASDLGNEYQLGEEEKQRLAQIITDAEANGSSVYRAIGLIAGFLGDEKLTSIATSQHEKGELEKAYREGALARGGDQALRPTG
jgi:hypothetical protein